MENKEKKLGQEPAFPYIEDNYPNTKIGMSKRFYAASLVASGIIANSKDMSDRTNFIDKIINFLFGSGNMTYSHGNIRQIAATAYKIADELLKQENE